MMCVVSGLLCVLRQSYLSFDVCCVSFVVCFVMVVGPCCSAGACCCDCLFLFDKCWLLFVA